MSELRSRSRANPREEEETLDDSPKTILPSTTLSPNSQHPDCPRPDFPQPSLPVSQKSRSGTPTSSHTGRHETRDCLHRTSNLKRFAIVPIFVVIGALAVVIACGDRFRSASVTSGPAPSIRFTVATHNANQVKTEAWREELNTPLDLLKQSWGVKQKSLTCRELLQSSVSTDDLPAVRASENGFVLTAIEAYNGHHHLVLRPDDVWIAILTQFNFYVNAHAEELRSQFVQHKGKKELTVKAVGTRYTVDFGALANQMTAEIHKNVIDKELRSWILPDFSTTTKSDTITSAVLMMGTMKAYFSYKMMLLCGIPSVTLEGEKSDWEKLLSRLGKLSTFGPEPAAWEKLLRPILGRFVRAFDGEPDVEFWGQICHHIGGGSGPTYLSGWITAFSVWSSEGEWQGPPLTSIESLEHPGLGISQNASSPQAQLIMDGMAYPMIDADESVPVGFGAVDVKLDDNGEIFDCMMVSGHVGYRVEGNADTLRPFSAWFMFVKGERDAEDDPDDW